MERRYFAFLRRLQAKGRSNMYGAVPYLMRAFGLGREQAFRVVCEWVDRQAELDSCPPERTILVKRKRKKLSKTTT